jgi:hypothetical protein
MHHDERNKSPGITDRGNYVIAQGVLDALSSLFAS